MAITGTHVLLYSSEADQLRATLGEVMGWNSVDAGGGWKILALPPAELGVHPGEKPAHEVTFMCDDIAATMDELRSKGIEFKGEPKDERFGIAVTMVLPGSVDLMLYEPHHPTAI